MRSVLPSGSVLLALAAGCGPSHGAEDDASWWNPASDLEVEETVEFTDVPYDFTGETPIADLPVLEPFEVEYADDGLDLPDCPDWGTTDALPAEIEGVVTILPRYYFKTDGCDGDEEKFYGSYFVQDSSGGHFVLGDSKTAHFGAGDRVTISVRGLANRFDLPMIVAHDVLSVAPTPQPMYYEEATGPFGLPDIALVRRVTGTVSTPMDTFGAFTVTGDDGTDWAVSLDSDLNRRGVDYPPGTRVTVTGPVQYSFSIFSIVVMQKGQVQVLEPSDESPGE